MLIFRPLIRCFNFTGRASLAEYWLFVLLQTLFYGFCVFMGLSALATAGGVSAAMLGLLKWFAIAGLAMLLLAIPNYSAMARRLHDSGRSLLWIGLMIPAWFSQQIAMRAIGRGNRRHFEQTTDSIRAFDGSAYDLPPSPGLTPSPYGNLTPADFTANFTPEGFMGLIGGDATVIAALGFGMLCNLALFAFLLMPGTHGPNRFGPDPRNPDAVAPDPAALGGYDEARLDALFAEARRDQGLQTEPAQTYRPVFDFSPGATGPMRSDIPHSAWNPDPTEPGPDLTPIRDAAPPPRPFPGRPDLSPHPTAPLPAAAPFSGGADFDHALAPARPFGRRGA